MADAADPFYSGLLRKGSIAYSRGDYATATRDLEVACFGLLDEAGPLTDCLVRLGLAQAAIGDAEGFRQTAERLFEVEELLGSYATAPTPPELKAAYEQELVRYLPQGVLATVPTFAQLIPPPAGLTVVSTTPQPSREPLEELLREDPDNVEGLLELARIELAEKQTEQAINLLDRLLVLAPESSAARCLRGQAWALKKDCTRVVADLQACEETAIDPELATTQMECLAKLKRWEEASALYAELPADIQARSKVGRLGSKAYRKGARQATSAQAPAVQTAATPTAENLSRLSQLQAGLRASSSASELASVHSRIRELANEDPSWPQAQLLAAESAYRLSFWQESVAFFQRAGDPGDDQPRLLFYMAVSLYESGDLEGAATALERALPALERNAFVDSYVTRILGSQETSG